MSACDQVTFSDVHIDPDRACDLCGGPLLTTNLTGVCRTTIKCRAENLRRRRSKSDAKRFRCKVCGGPIGKRNMIGICRTNNRCKTEAKRAHDRRYHLAHKNKRAARVSERPPGERRPHRQTILLPEDGEFDEVAIRIAVSGQRKVSLTHRERLEVIRLMLGQGASIREMCDHLHIQPKIVRELLDELGYECVRNEHILGSKIMVILPKNRVRGTKILPPETPMSIKPSASRKRKP